MPPVAHSEFPPPFSSESVIAKPTDPEDERIEVGVAVVGAGPAGLAAAIKTLQLLEDRPELAVDGVSLVRIYKRHAAFHLVQVPAARSDNFAVDIEAFITGDVGHDPSGFGDDLRFGVYGAAEDRFHGRSIERPHFFDDVTELIEKLASALGNAITMTWNDDFCP